MEIRQLVSYIAPGAPATRRLAEGNEPFLRPEIGFTPSWYRQTLDISFHEKFHRNPAYRAVCLRKMRKELQRRFPGTHIGGIQWKDHPLDLLTGTYGACTIAAIFGIPILYDENGWPTSAPQYLDIPQLARLEPPDLDRNPHFQELMEQVAWIRKEEGTVDGFINWQGVLNNAQRLRGEMLFLEMKEEPDLARHIFSCVAETMADAIRRLHIAQEDAGFLPRFITVSNCCVNMISPKTYQELLAPLDRRLAEVYRCIGIHNCSWSATPYLEVYAGVPWVGYIDMGIKSSLARARQLFPHARRGLMYTPMDLATRSLEEIRADLEKVAADYGPADIVLADIEAGTPDEKVKAVYDLYRQWEDVLR